MFARLGEKMFEGSFARFKQCLSSDKKTLNLATRVETYEFCPRPDMLAPALPRVDRTIPNEAE